MPNEVVTVAPQKIVAELAGQYSLDPQVFENTIVNTCFSEKDAAALSREEFYAFLIVAKTHGLNPLLREIYGMRKKGGGVQAVVGVDGWLNLMNKNPQFDGMTFSDNLHQPDPKRPPEVISITCQIYRKDRAHPTIATEYLAECRQQTEPWTKWPTRMLRHKAVIQAARMAFGFAGIVDPDEAQRIKGGELDGIGRADPPPVPQEQPQDRPRRGRPPKVAVAPPAPPEDVRPVEDGEFQTPVPPGPVNAAPTAEEIAEDEEPEDLVEYADPDSGELRHVTVQELEALTIEDERRAARKAEEEAEKARAERAAKAEALRKQLAELADDEPRWGEHGVTIERLEPRPQKDNVVEITDEQKKANAALTANPLAIPAFLKREKTPPTPPNGPAWPSGLKDPDSFLKRLDTELSRLDDGDEMQALWERHVDPQFKDLFPPDGEEAQAILRHHMSKVAP